MVKSLIKYGVAAAALIAMMASPAFAGSKYVMRASDGALGEMRTSLIGSGEPYFDFAINYSDFMGNLAFPSIQNPGLRNQLPHFKKATSLEGHFMDFDPAKAKASDLDGNGYLSSSELAKASGLNEFEISAGIGSMEKAIEAAMKGGGANKSDNSSSSPSSPGGGAI